MQIARVAFFSGTLVLGLGCSKDGVVLGTGGEGGTTQTTSTGGGGGTGETTTSATGGAGGSGGDTGTTTDTGGAGGTGGTMTTSPTGSGGGTTTTPVVDADQDGWSVADGDCCDTDSAPCFAENPELVNPGALEIPANGVDDDCDPATLDTDPLATCSTAAQAATDLLMGAPTSAAKVVKAMDLCQFTTEDPPLSQKTWGVISAQYVLADGSAASEPKNIQVGVLPDFGPNVKPQFGETLAAISSGTARREGDPGFVHPKSGGPGQTGSFDAETACPAAPSYVAASGGSLPSECSECMGPDCTTAYDSVSLRLRIRPPTNAKGFSYRLDFFSSEYPQYVCQDYNDFFLTLIGGNLSPQIPLHGNVAADSTGAPISVNNLLFDVCMPMAGYPCQGGTLELVGNGWGGWGGSILDGGATGWLQNDVPLALKTGPSGEDDDLVPTAEPLELQFIIWDGGDHNVDSIVLLDRFRWSIQPLVLSIHD